MQSPTSEQNRRAPQLQEFPAIDPQRILAMVRRRFRPMVIAALTVFIAAVVFTLLQKPMYQATATLVLEPRREQVIDTKAVLAGLGSDTTAIDTEVQVLKSNQLISEVVSDLNLRQDPEFNAALRPPGPLAQVKAMIPRPRPSSPALGAFIAEQATIDAFKSQLAPRRSNMTSMIDVSFKSEDPRKAATIANYVVQRYRRDQLSVKFDATKEATGLLNTRLGELRQQVLSDEAAVQQFKIANNLLSASGTNLTEQEISNFNQTLADANARVAEDQARLRTAQSQLSRGSAGDDVGEALASPVIQELRKKRSEISGRVADLQGRYGDRYPDILKARRELTDVDTQIEQEIARIISNLQAKAQVSQQRAAAIDGSLSSARGTLASNNRATVRLNELQRNADASRSLYESYLNRFKETTTQQGLEQPDTRVMAIADVPIRPSSPKVIMNLAMGFVVALAAAAAAMVIAEFFENGLATSEDVERKLDIPYLGLIPDLASIADRPVANPADYLLQKPLSAFAEAFQALRTSATHARHGEPVKVVVFTSALPKEGKTTTAACMARSAAMAGVKVIILDCDLRRRNINNLLKMQADTGLLEFLTGKATFEEVLQIDEASGAHVIPLSPATVSSQDIFSSQAMDQLLQRLRDTYDLVLLDSGPVIAVSDSRVLAEKADAVVFVTRWRKTPVKAVDGGLKLIEDLGGYVAGVVLTQVNMKQQASYGYGDTSYYYKQYKSYYLT